jgi:hypothetical protein
MKSKVVISSDVTVELNGKTRVINGPLSIAELTDQVKLFEKHHGTEPAKTRKPKAPKTEAGNGAEHPAGDQAAQ